VTKPRFWTTAPLTRAAMAGAAIMMAHQVAGKAARDAFFLSAYPPGDLPRMVIAAAAASVLLGLLFSALLRRVGPRRAVPGACALSALLHALQYALQPAFPNFIAVGVYLHIVAFGAVLLSGFWSLASELFDPRAAKLQFGRIAGAGTAGGIAGGSAAALFPLASALLLLAAFHLLAAAALWWLQRAPDAAQPAPPADVPALQVFRRAPYLWSLAALVLLSSSSAAIVDYLFKSGAAASFGAGGRLLRFFAVFYTGTQVLTFLAQSTLTRISLQRFGLGRTVGALPMALGAGGAAALVIPVFPIFAALRVLEFTLRGSLFRSAYELFYTPVPPADKRAAKTIIDVGFDRLGDATGAAVVQAALWLAPALAASEVLGVAVVFAMAAAWLAARLDHTYGEVLERRLLDRAVELDLTGASDSTTRSAILRSVTFSRPGKAAAQTPPAPAPAADPLLGQLEELRCGQAARVHAALASLEPLNPLLAPQVVRLLAWNEVAAAARQVLERAAGSVTGVLLDHLLDPHEDFSIRRRIPRLLAQTLTPRAVEGLLAALDDARFEVRFHCGRALDHLHVQAPSLAISAARVYAVVERELSVSKPLWESRRLLDQRDSSDAYSFLDDHLRERAGQSLEHVFSLLATILPREPLKVAFRALHTGDKLLRGLAQEYLECVLPAGVRERLWALLESPPPRNAAPPPPEEVLARLLASNESMLLRLKPAAPAAEGRPAGDSETG
jgi:hypothetical protein